MKLLILALLPFLVYGEKWHKAIICESESSVLSCPSDQKLSIQKAFYGRQDADICPGGTVRTTQCQSPDSMSVIGNKCNGRNSCEIEASSTVFGNPCEGTSKYVEVHYLCEKVARIPTRVICEGNSDTITCPAGRVIKVKKASYGRHDWKTCNHPAIKDLFCHAKGSQNKIKSICNGKNSCTLSATNSLFGDPCRGTYKYVEMTYRCKKPSNPDPCVDEHGNPISTAPFEKPGDCDHFYQCSNGILHTMPCAPGTAFNPDIGVCDWPHNVEGCH